MFGLGMSEVVLIGIVALIVVGPKDLPQLFRTLGQFTGKARGMAREFSRAMEAAADESGVRDIKKTLDAAANPAKFGTDKFKAATGMKDSKTMKALEEERAAGKAKMDATLARVARAREEREAAEAAAAAPVEAPAPATTSEDDTK